MKLRFRRMMAALRSTAMVVSAVPAVSVTTQAASSEEHINLTRKAAGEGMVLMENNVVDEASGTKALPLAEGETVAMFGRAAIDYVRGGGGSGSTNVQYSRNILQGMKIKEDEGKINLVPELTDFYTEQVTTNGITNDANITITDDVWNAAAAATETAIVTIGRYSSEGSDRSATAGDYYLSEAEIALLERVAAEFEKTIVVLNVGAVLDTSWIKGEDAIEGIDAVLMGWQAGMEGGLATADVLVGDVNPSGKFVDTFAKSYDDYPSSTTFNESTSYVNYTEDIFVGYRYFETFDPNYNRVNYEFGYGLSYTTFDISEETVTVDGDDIVVTAKVTNTGDVAGKEVVQVYFSAPEGALVKPAKELAAFAKTGLLAPGESQTLTMSYAIADMSSYDDLGSTGYESAYVLEAGDYNIYVGDSIKNAGQNGIVDVYTVGETTVVEQLSELCDPIQLSERLAGIATDDDGTLLVEEDGTYTRNYVEMEVSEEYSPHYTVAAEGQTVVQMENYIDASSTLCAEAFYDDNMVQQRCLACMNTAGYYAEYELTAEQSGQYSVIMCYANGNADLLNVFTVSVNGETQSGVQFDAPQTGDGDGAAEWYNFVEAEPFYINLEEGVNLVRFTANRNNPNYDYMILERVGEVDNSYPRKISAAEPTVVQAESYDATTAGVISNTATRLETFTGGTCLAYMNFQGNEVQYYMDVEAAGEYELVLNAANGRTGFSFDPGVYVDNRSFQTFITAVQTGDGEGAFEWYNFEDLAPVTITLPEGNCILTLRAPLASYPNIDYFTLTRVGDAAEAYDIAISATETTRVEAENFDERGSGATGYQVRNENFEVDGNSGTCLAFMNHVDNYVRYYLNVEEAGEYDIVMYAANGFDPYDFEPNISINGTAYPATVSVETTSTDGNIWYNFVALDPVTVTLPEGECVLEMKCSAADAFPNLDYMTFTKKAEEADAGTAAASYSLKARNVEAQSDTIMLLDVYNDPTLMDAFLDQISDEQLIAMLGGQANTGVANTGGMGNLMEFGIPNAMTADGPQGIRIGNTCTAWPIGTLLASSWDVDLVEEVAKAAAIEAVNNGIDIWLAPGMNIHRDPLCGRNFEYYSEDPLISGKMAAAATRGCQSQNVAITLKHFTTNNKEVNRNSSDSRVSERALREIYLKGFEIAVKEADPWCIMTSYNFLNGIETSENQELLTGIARGEWGYNGLFMTDWGNQSNHARELLAGNDVKMPSGSPTVLATALSSGMITRDNIETSIERLMNMIMKVNIFQTKIVNPPVVTIGDSTIFKAAENIIWSATARAEVTSDTDGGNNLGYCDAGAYTQYQIDVTKSGTYDLAARATSNAGAGMFNVLVDGEIIATFDVPNTGGWQNWTTLDAQSVHLDAGEHTMRIEFTESGSNLNWLSFSLTEADVDPTLTTAKESLNSLYTAYADTDLSGYTTESAAALTAALTAAKEVLDDEDATLQEVNTATSDLMAAIGGLESAVQKVHLQTAIDSAEEIIAETANADTVADLVAAVEAGKAVLESETATQAEVDEATNAILDALAALPVDGDMTALKELIAAAENLSNDKYTSDSRAVLDEAIAAAKEVVAGGGDNDAINEAYAAIIDAVIGLVTRGNKAALNAVIAKADTIMAAESSYVTATLEGLAEALASAKEVQADEDALQPAIDAEVKVLTIELTEVRLLGDVNNDGVVTTSDSAAVLRAAAEYTTLSAEDAASADVNGDGTADTSDAVLILQYSAEMISEF